MPRDATTTGQTPIAFVRAITGAYAARGLDPSAALQKARIAPADLARSRARVTAVQFERLCAAAMQELDDEAPGWFSRRLPWGSYGMLARASIS
ncbi:MAG TPA: AraC family transcriptional regulator ligand-binding domain-containing protein, partial [Ottowia sp.]|nr:AraC family transcriptional regulator ligand-binding domain-containing protein [Ottowia sp.]